MKKITVLFSLIVSFLFSFSYFVVSPKETEKALLLYKEEPCTPQASSVTITTVDSQIDGTGVIVFEGENYFYIATSSVYYDKNQQYEVIFDDYSRKAASFVGVAHKDGVMVLQAEKANVAACGVEFSKSEYIDVGENVHIFGKHEYHDIYADAFVSNVGVCENCNEETYKYYYHSIITSDIPYYFIGAGVYDYGGKLLGIINKQDETYKLGNNMLDVNKLYVICYNLVNKGKYSKNYIEYNLLDVNSLTNYEKYLYSLDKEMTSGVLVSSIHYANYLFGGLNQGMVILAVNGIPVDNCYEFDREISKYQKGESLELTVLTIGKRYKTYRVKI